MNRKRLTTCLTILCVGSAFLGFITVFIQSSLFSDSFSEESVISTMGRAIGNTSEAPSQPIVPDFTFPISVLASVCTIIASLAGLLKWLSWKSKHGKNRTPIVLPSLSYED